MSRSTSLPSILLLALCIPSCGGDAPTADKKPAATAGAGKFDPADDSAKPTAPPTDGETGAAATGGPADAGPVDPFGDTAEWDTDNPDDDANDGDSDSGESGDEPAATGGDTAAAAHPGPCTIKWSSGTVVRFKYKGETAGTMTIDADGNGKSDVCGAFELSDGKPSTIKVDDGCDKKVDLEITPKFAADQNLATAKVLDNSSGKTSDLTLVALPSFTGVMPGYPLHSAKKKLGLTVRDSLVRTARVKTPTEGPMLKATFFYDGDKRIKTVKEDLASDGTVDQRYDYRYDASGNITRITLTRTTGELKAKTTAKLDYSCWK